MSKIPVTVFTGFLGSGKTTIILNLIKQLDPDYRVVWLKNEYGSINVDSELAKENNIEVKEMLNGCLCCVLVGRLQTALKEILQEYKPQRIIIETSGTAYPAPIVWEVEKIPELQIDGVVTVIDAVNFNGYTDKSYTAQLQAKYTDLFIINKTDLVTENELDKRLDDVYDLNPSTPKLKTADGNVSKDLIFGLDSHVIGVPLVNESALQHADEFDIVSFIDAERTYDKQKLHQLLVQLDHFDYYRIKGLINTQNGVWMLNMVAGRISWTQLKKYKGPTKIVFMGRGILMSEAELFKSLHGARNPKSAVG
jgi:G3E family GTPase